MLNPKTKLKMANYNTNEKALLTYLEELKSQTLSSYTSEIETRDYWISGRYKRDVANGSMMQPTNHQIDFFITNCENRLNPLSFRLMWLENQIKEITNLKNIGKVAA